MKRIALIISILALSGCSSLAKKDERMAVDTGHLDTPAPVAEQAAPGIPEVVAQVPVIAEPEPPEPLQTFTVVATDLPANELLFALARDARLNLDIDPSINDRISLNAIDQTLPQILNRISRQIELRFYVDGPNLVIERDRPFMRVYRIDYLNMARTTSGSVSISTTISSAGAEGGATGSSSTSVSNTSSNNFWATMEANITVLAGSGGSIISNRESGTISVQATSAAHDNIQRFVDQVVSSARRQVLIEATVVEVTLNDDFQTGVDWSSLTTGEGWNLQQAGQAQALGFAPFTGEFVDIDDDRTFTAAISALDSFGDVSVMSSPKIMALNNQTSVLKVADNVVYFEVEAKVGDSGNTPGTVAYTTTAKTVPVGFVMNVTPFITEDREIILNIRPTITRILRFVNDPNPGLAVDSPVPEIQVREMESVLRVSDGNTAVIGGLMQDTANKENSGLPGLQDSESFGWLFGQRSRELDKTELVIFLRPRIVDNASIDTNLQDFQQYLKPELFSEFGE